MDDNMNDRPITRRPTFRIAVIALAILGLDQFTKQLVLRHLVLGDRRVVISGFFDLVHWMNTGAAWSMFTGNNLLLAFVALLALCVLFVSRHYFDAHTRVGQMALGLIFGGILGNLIDRIFLNHVTDFLYFYLQRRGGNVLDFPAFNIADSAICVGVGLIFIMSWRNENAGAKSGRPCPPAPN
jgi:signal peptidase II